MLIILKYTLVQQSKGTSQLLVVFWAHKQKNHIVRNTKEFKKKK